MEESDMENGFIRIKTFLNGGYVAEHEAVDRSKKDYGPIRSIAYRFAEMGKKVSILPVMHHKSEGYRNIFGRLTGTKYERKCPDLIVDEVFYEYEGYRRPWNRRKIKNMLAHGVMQSSFLIIDNTKGGADRLIRGAISRKNKIDPAALNEVWIYEKGHIRLFFRNGDFYKYNREDSCPPYDARTAVLA